MKKIIIMFLVSALCMSSQSVFAAKKKPAFYAGLGGGITKFDTQIGSGELDFNDDDAGLKVYGGMMMDKYFGLELTYFNFGEFGDDGIIDGVPFDLDIDDMWAVALSLSPVIPVYKQLSLVTRLGIAYWEIDATISGGGVSASGSDDGYDITYGLGPRFTVNKNIAIEAGWDRLNLDGDDLDLYSIGVRISTR